MRFFMGVKKRILVTNVMLALAAAGLWGCGAKDTEPPETQSQEQVDPPDDGEDVIDSAEEGEGFATAQEAVLSYLAALRDNDFGCMEETFIDKSKMTAVSSQYAYLCGIDLIPELASEGYVRLSESGDAEEFLEVLTEKIEGTDFKNMEFLGFVPPHYLDDRCEMDAYQESLEINARKNGGSEMQNQVAAIRVDGAKYLLFFDTIRVDDRWYVFQLGGILPTFMGAEPDDVGTLRLDGEDEEILEMLLSENTDISKLPESGTGTVEQTRTESAGFDTPQEAAAAYLEGLKTCDEEKMLSTFAVESYAHNFDMSAYLEYLQAYMFLYQDIKVPVINDFTEAMISCERKEQLREDMLGQGSAFYLWQCYFDDIEPDMDKMFFSWEEVREETALDSIELVGFIAPEALLEDRIVELNKNRTGKRIRFLGADQIQDCAAVFTCGGGTYCLFMEEIQYEGKWYNNSLGNYTSMALDVYADNMGTVPLEWLGEPAEVEPLVEAWEVE